MATLGLHGSHRFGGLKVRSDYLRAAAVAAMVLIVPTTASVIILSLQQVIPRQSYPASGADCSRYTQLTLKARAPSPIFVQSGDRCEVADYGRFVEGAKNYNLRLGLTVGVSAVVLMVGLVVATFRIKAS